MPPRHRQLPKQFGATVRTLRKKAGLTQLKLAERADLALTYVGEIERGEKVVSLETIRQLGEALSLSAAELLKRAGI
jgi:transcriptional regulator with XRE-family HTH domain